MVTMKRELTDIYRKNYRPLPSFLIILILYVYLLNKEYT